jgi:hypothetical protein
VAQVAIEAQDLVLIWLDLLLNLVFLLIFKHLLQSKLLVNHLQVHVCLTTQLYRVLQLEEVLFLGLIVWIVPLLKIRNESFLIGLHMSPRTDSFSNLLSVAWIRAQMQTDE